MTLQHNTSGLQQQPQRDPPTVRAWEPMSIPAVSYHFIFLFPCLGNFLMASRRSWIMGPEHLLWKLRKLFDIALFRRIDAHFHPLYPFGRQTRFHIWTQVCWPKRQCRYLQSFLEHTLPHPNTREHPNRTTRLDVSRRL